ncbi:MAG: potassium/proton antiporter [Bacteroidales bacterium]|nr:potassium/proton antiporter [Bacteroidales bacterium]
MHLSIFLLSGLIIALIVLIASFFKHWNIPLILIALAIGIIFGSDVTGIIYFDNAELTKQITDIALMFILFAGGYETKTKDLKNILKPALLLSSIGVLLTGVICALLFSLIFKWDFLHSLLLSAIISSTDASAIFSILRGGNIDKQTTSLIKLESATNDPMAIIFTTFLIQLSQGFNFTFSTILIFLWLFIGGIAIGILIGVLSKIIIKKIKDLDAGYYHLLIIGIIFFSFGIAELCNANGLMAVFFTGLILGNTKLPYNNRIASFTDTLSFITNVVIYVLLGLLAFPSKFPEIYLYGIGLFLILTLVARPVTVFLLTAFTKLSIQKKTFISWSGIRGTVPIVLATYPLIAGLDPNHQMFNIIFIAVILSIVVQGPSLNKIANILKLASKKRKNVLNSMELVTVHDTEVDLIEIFIDDELYSGECRIADLNLPPNSTITMINRNNEVIAPSGQTVILPGDVLYVLVEKDNIDMAIDEILSNFEKINY